MKVAIAARGPVVGLTTFGIRPPTDQKSCSGDSSAPSCRGTTRIVGGCDFIRDLGENSRRDGNCLRTETEDDCDFSHSKYPTRWGNKWYEERGHFLSEAVSTTEPSRLKNIS